MCEAMKKPAAPKPADLKAQEIDKLVATINSSVGPETLLSNASST